MSVRLATWVRTAAIGALISAAACKTDETVEPPPPPPDGPPITSVAPAAETGTEFWSPFDAAPSPDGDKIYFTALVDDSQPAVLSVSASGGAATRLFAGDPLAAPFSVMPSKDGNTLYISDSGAEVEDNPALGRIFSMPSAGGTPTSLTAAEGTVPRSLDLVDENGAESLYFTGLDDQQRPSVFKMDTSGAAKTSVLTGSPLVAPGGIAVAQDGTIYVADSDAGAGGSAAVVKIAAGVGSVLVDDLSLGYPSGVALELDGSALYVSGLDKELGTSVVYRIDLASNEVITLSSGISQNTESAGVHRAHNANVYAWANASGSRKKPAGGAVYLLKGR